MTTRGATALLGFGTALALTLPLLPLTPVTAATPARPAAVRALAATPFPTEVLTPPLVQTCGRLTTSPRVVRLAAPVGDEQALHVVLGSLRSNYDVTVKQGDAVRAVAAARGLRPEDTVARLTAGTPVDVVVGVGPGGTAGRRFCLGVQTLAPGVNVLSTRVRTRCTAPRSAQQCQAVADVYNNTGYALDLRSTLTYRSASGSVLKRLTGASPGGSTLVAVAGAGLRPAGTTPPEQVSVALTGALSRGVVAVFGDSGAPSLARPAGTVRVSYTVSLALTLTTNLPGCGGTGVLRARIDRRHVLPAAEAAAGPRWRAGRFAGWVRATPTTGVGPTSHAALVLVGRNRAGVVAYVLRQTTRVVPDEATHRWASDLTRFDPAFPAGVAAWRAQGTLLVTYGLLSLQVC